ncbi:hypothetical protein N657DRAFT_673191 [Parathielavia appendiculata]|uniref:Uncharacterized protein n=1 Tax=Parathielavia appendiculata TaxID=2587402 RepID=A0AAN6Z1K0_9PEZI|nr:hypothetical protein N657DRAFT_673191 [Parathielavia appendiculata]
MVNLALPLAALAMAASVAAAPAATNGTVFSFAQWVEDIIANPDTALTVDEAFAAAQAADVVGAAGGLQKRVRCEVPGWTRAPGRDAAWCVDYLARIGQGGQQCVLDRGNIQMCRRGGAQIVASQARSERLSANCNDVARTAGIIFDNCWRSDDTILGSEICITENRMQININGI